MLWLKLIPTIISTLYEVYKVLRDLSKDGHDLKTCTVEVKTGGKCP